MLQEILKGWNGKDKRKWTGTTKGQGRRKGRKEATGEAIKGGRRRLRLILDLDYFRLFQILFVNYIEEVTFDLSTSEL